MKLFESKYSDIIDKLQNRVKIKESLEEIERYLKELEEEVIYKDTVGIKSVQDNLSLLTTNLSKIWSIQDYGWIDKYNGIE